MKTAAIICEYNPFHNGHRYQIEEIRRQLGADHIIAVMSGDFVQRGAPAFCGKYARASFALQNGIDLVLELPVCYAGASAEYFARGGVTLLNALNLVDFLVFGTESPSLEPLEACARLLLHEPEEYRFLLQQQLKNGSSFPAARASAVSMVCGEEAGKVLSEPNNILAVEYIKALLSCGSDIRPYAVLRTGAGYHDTALHSFASATAIRRELSAGGAADTLRQTVPENVFSFFQSSFEKTFPVVWDDFKDMLYYQLMTDPHPEQYLDYHPELMERIRRSCRDYPDVGTLIARVKSRNFTYTRISRFLLHLMLKITKEDALASCGYAKVLGMKRSHSSLIRQLNRRSDIPVIQKISRYRSYLDEDAIRSFEQTLTASSLYRYAVNQAYGTELPSELLQPLLIV